MKNKNCKGLNSKNPNKSSNIVNDFRLKKLLQSGEKRVVTVSTFSL